MRWGVTAVVAVAAGLSMNAAPQAEDYTPLDAGQQQHTLDAIRQYAIHYTENLPNFICTQITRRNYDRSGSGNNWQQVDKLQEQVSYFDHHESYKVRAVNGQMVNNKDHFKLGGTISSGEFGSMMDEIFDPQTAAEFHYARTGKLDGHSVDEFDYDVPQARSHYSIENTESGRKIIAGYHGRIWARRDGNAVVRITLECEDIPADFEVQDVSLDLWYGLMNISGRDFMLPLKWDMHSREGRTLVWNQAEFALYRKFGTESSITFDAPDDTAKPPEGKKDR